MDKYRELIQRLQAIADKAQKTVMYQGTVQSVEGKTCTVRFGSLVIPGVRIRASLKDENGELLVTPAVGSEVIAGTLHGDLNSLVIMACDKAQGITINGGSLGGLVNIGALTEKLNDLVTAFNAHTHPCTTGTTSPTVDHQASMFSKGDYEDASVKH